VVHSLASTAPAAGRFRRVTTVHDLHFLTASEAHFGLRALGMRALVPLGAHRSHRIITDSAFVRDEIVERLRIARERIDVVPLGLGRPPAGPATPEPDLRRRYELGDRPLLLSLSAKRPHKNLTGLLRALALIGPERRPVALLAGYATPHEDELRELAGSLGLLGDVRFTGWTSDADAEGLLAMSAGFVFPSFSEGFGLPVLEAMARGVPVACSDRSSLPEVAGDAALLFDPAEPGQIAAAIERLLFEPGLAERLSAAGRARAATFTWRRTAELTLDAYRRGQ
jgi:glycosyltransferase involved in cell wall biosynthesis